MVRPRHEFDSITPYGALAALGCQACVVCVSKSCHTSAVTDTEPGQRMPDHLARTVARLREQQRLPLTELSDRLAKLGQPIPVLGLRRLEAGERKVDVNELAALAKALGVPPLTLILPVGDVEWVEVLPGVMRQTWDAAKWFTGESPLSSEPTYDSVGAFTGYTQSSADFNEWHTGARKLELMREHDRLLMQWRLATMHTMSDLAAARDATDPEQKRRLQQLADDGVTDAREVEKALLDHRRYMDQQGIVLPNVPELRPEQRKALADFGLTAAVASEGPIEVPPGEEWGTPRGANGAR